MAFAECCVLRAVGSKCCIITSSFPLAKCSSLVLVNSDMVFTVLWLCFCEPRLRLDEPPPPPPMVTNPLLGFLYAFLPLVERLRLANKGANQVLNNGKVLGRLVVMTAMKVSLVPHSAASCPPSTGSCDKISLLLQ